MIPHDNLEEFHDPGNYDLEEAAQSLPRIEHYAALAGRIGGPVLELACGTGLVALPIAARGLAVTGVDLSRPMLDHARAKALRAGLAVDWIETDARHVELGRRFQFIYITGNAFQAFLGMPDQRQLLDTVTRHLALGGTFAFETRNPTGHDLSDRPDEEPWFDYVSVQGHRVAVSGTQRFDAAAQVLHWTTWRRWHDGRRAHTTTTRITCRFSGPDELVALLADRGFVVERMTGDWAGAPLTPASEHIVCECRLS